MFHTPAHKQSSALVLQRAFATIPVAPISTVDFSELARLGAEYDAELDHDEGYEAGIAGHPAPAGASGAKLAGWQQGISDRRDAIAAGAISGKYERCARCAKASRGSFYCLGCSRQEDAMAQYGH